MSKKKSIFVVGYPCTGTRLLIDFIRKNFPIFNRRLKLWQNSDKIYVDLDRPNWRERVAEELSSGQTHLIFQSHYAGLRTNNDVDACLEFDIKKRLYFYPFRRPAVTIKSYAEFSNYRGPIDEFICEPDWFFGTEKNVGDSIRGHIERWLSRDAHFIDMDRLLAQPDLSCHFLAKLLNRKPLDLPNRLPKRRRFHGRLGELTERLRGRESSERRVAVRLAWRDSDEVIALDNHFSDVYGRLLARRVN